MRRTIDINLIIALLSATHIDNLITIAEDRKDAIVFASPERADVVNVTDSTQVSNVVAFFNNIRSSFMLFLIVTTNMLMTDTMMYSDLYLYVIDITNLCARTDLVADSHFSPPLSSTEVVRTQLNLLLTQLNNKGTIYTETELIQL